MTAAGAPPVPGKKRMRILFITENYPPESNASATRVSERMPYWLAEGQRVTVVTQAPNFPEGRLFAGYRNRWRQEETRDGVRVIRVKTYMAANAGFVRRILDFTTLMNGAFWVSLFLKRPDIVVATSPQFFAAVAGWMIATVRRVPFIFELSDLWPASIRAVGAIRRSRLLDLIEKLELFLYRRSAAVIALSPSFKDDLVARGIDPDKIHVVTNGVDMSRYAPRGRSPALAAELGLTGRFVVGYVGTHGMAHDLQRVLDAAELLADRDDVRFLFAGSGSGKAALVAAAAERGVDNVVFLDRQPKERMPEVWSLCDVALIHLKNDPVFAGVIPSKIFEAMAMRLPSLYVGPRGTGSGIVEKEECGVWVEPEQPEAFAAAVLRLADDRALLDRLSARALAAAPDYSRERQARDFLQVLRRHGERNAS